jgi:hypothetical protein
MLSRRDLVGKLAAGTAALWTVAAARSSFASTRREVSTGTADAGSRTRGEPLTAAQTQPAASADPSAPIPIAETSPKVVDTGAPATLSAPAPWELLRPLAMGSPVGQGWRIAGLTGAANGSCVLTLQNRQGREHRIHICRNDGNARGLVYTERFDLVVMNGGVGDLPTEEGFAQAVARISHVLAANEGSGQHRPIVTALLPHAERVRRFSGTMDRTLR